MKILPTFIANLAHGVGLLLLRFSAHLHGHGTMQGGILSKCKSKNTLFWSSLRVDIVTEGALLTTQKIKKDLKSFDEFLIDIYILVRFVPLVIDHNLGYKS